MIRIKHALVSAAVALAVFVGLGNAHAGGTVLRIAGHDIYIDLGTSTGVGPGSRLTLYHVILAKHPVSGQTLRDRFALGELTVTKAGDKLCIAHASDELRPRVRVGDEVELASQPVAFRDPWIEHIERRDRERTEAAKPRTRTPRQPRRNPGEPRPDPARERALAAISAAEDAEDAWSKTLGRPPAERIAVWQQFLNDHPNSPYSDNARDEIRRLAAQIEQERQLAEQLADPGSERTRIRASRLSVLTNETFAGPLAVQVPDSIYQGTEIPLSFAVLAPEAIDRAWLYYRKSGEDSYQRVSLTSDGDAYLRATIPAKLVMPPGVDYFVEVAGGPDEEPRPVLGNQEVPRQIAVDRKLEEEPAEIEDRSRVTVFVDYVDFDGGAGAGFDQYLHAEIDFMYRFFKPVYAMRVGFGTLGGIGGPADAIDNDPNGECRDNAGTGDVRCRRVTYSYAYTELEFRFSNTIALMLRPQFGTVTSDRQLDADDSNRCLENALDDDCSLFSAAGLRARVRFGSEQATNLVLGVGLTQDIGTVFEAAFHWDVIPKFPVKLSAQVTDQPVPEDFGVRLITDVGWRAISWVYPSLRLAYQARNVNHAGVSGGLALNFDW